MKTQIKYTLCYQTVTPESAEHGDFAEHGFMDESGNRFELEPGCHGKEAGKFKEDSTLTADGLRDLVDIAERFGILYHGDAGWAHNDGDEVTDCGTGGRTEYSLHVEQGRHWHHVMNALAVKPCARPDDENSRAMDAERSDLETPSDYPQDYNSAAQDLMDPLAERPLQSIYNYSTFSLDILEHSSP